MAWIHLHGFPHQPESDGKDQVESGCVHMFLSVVLGQGVHGHVCAHVRYLCSACLVSDTWCHLGPHSWFWSSRVTVVAAVWPILAVGPG